MNLRAFPVIYAKDVDGTVARLHETGAAVLREPADIPWGERVAFARDPEGNLVSLATAAGGRRPAAAGDRRKRT